MHPNNEIDHELLDCNDFHIIRPRFFRVNGLKELFDTVEPTKIFSFLKEIGMCSKILLSRGVFFFLFFFLFFFFFFGFVLCCLVCVYSSRWSRVRFRLSYLG